MNTRGLAMSPRRAHALIGLALAILATVLATCEAQDVGLARDEVIYIGAGAHYAAWWRGLVTFDHGVGTKSITDTFGGEMGGGNNPEHPPLMKTMFGFSQWLLHDELGICNEVTAARFASACTFGLAVALAFAFALEIWGVATGVIAALALMLVPRALFHASLACFDAPIMTWWLATVYAYYRALDRSNGRRWPWIAGVMFGFALATKHTAVLLPFALVVHYAWVGIRARAADPRKRWHLVITHRWQLFVAFIVVAPAVLFALWPWLWIAPVAHVTDWLKFHLNHVHYNYEYLGRNWNAPPFPWHVAIVTTALTVPVATLAAAAIGAVRWIGERGRHVRAPAVLLVLSFGASIGMFLLGSTPIFGAEKHWMPVLPTICIAAGVGVEWAARMLAGAIRARSPARQQLVARVALVVVAGAVVIAAATETVTAQPYALTSYNALAGGAPGGADLGMNRQFWGVAARGVLPFLSTLPPPAPTDRNKQRFIYTHDASPAWGLYRKLGMVPSWLADSGMEDAGVAHSDYAFVVHERHFNRHDYMIWQSYGTVAPVFVLRDDGVPIVSVYARPGVKP